MRPDLNKLLCERERSRSKDKFRNFRNTKRIKEFEGSRLTRGITYGYDSKVFNENLNPLYNFIRSCKGKNWDKVYSEICQTFDKRSVINQHVLDHLFQFVERNVIRRDDGDLYILSTYNGMIPLRDSLSEFYVHPETKILTKNTGLRPWRTVYRDRAAKVKAEKFAVERDIGEGVKAKKDKGIWYIETAYKEMKSMPKYIGISEETGRPVWGHELKEVDAIDRKQASKKQIKLYKLNSK